MLLRVLYGISVFLLLVAGVPTRLFEKQKQKMLVTAKIAVTVRFSLKNQNKQKSLRSSN